MISLKCNTAKKSEIRKKMQLYNQSTVEPCSMDTHLLQTTPYHLLQLCPVVSCLKVKGFYTCSFKAMQEQNLRQQHFISTKETNFKLRLHSRNETLVFQHLILYSYSLRWKNKHLHL